MTLDTAQIRAWFATFHTWTMRIAKWIAFIILVIMGLSLLDFKPLIRIEQITLYYPWLAYKPTEAFYFMIALYCYTRSA